MTLVRFTPFSDLETVHSQMNRIFDELTGWQQESKTAWQPSVELLNQDEHFILKASLPGVNKNDIEVSLTRQSVQLSGEYKYQSSPNKNQAHYSEFRYGKFSRTITLPKAINHEAVTADLVDGILTLTLPKVVPTPQKVVKLNLAEPTETATTSDTVNPTDTQTTNS